MFVKDRSGRVFMGGNNLTGPVGSELDSNHWAEWRKRNKGVITVFQVKCSVKSYGWVRCLLGHRWIKAVNGDGHTYKDGKYKICTQCARET